MSLAANLPAAGSPPGGASVQLYLPGSKEHMLELYFSGYAHRLVEAVQQMKGSVQALQDRADAIREAVPAANQTALDALTIDNNAIDRDVRQVVSDYATTSQN